MEPGSAEDAYLTHWLALAIDRARQTALDEKAVLDKAAVRALRAVRVEVRDGVPAHVGGIRAVHVLIGQLRPTNEAAPQWAAQATRQARSEGQSGYVRCEREPADGEDGPGELLAVTPDGEPMRVASAYSWPQRIRYVVVVELDARHDVAIVLRQEARRGYKDEAARVYDGTPKEHAQPDSWCTAVQVGEPYLRDVVMEHVEDVADPFPMGDDDMDERRRPMKEDLFRRWREEGTRPAAEMRLPSGAELPTDMRPSAHLAGLIGDEAEVDEPRLVAGDVRYDPRTRLTAPTQGHRSRLLEATIAFSYRQQGSVLVKPVLEAACVAHAGGAVVDVGRRHLFETGRWPGAPEYEEATHTQLRIAAEAFSMDTHVLGGQGDDKDLRDLMGKWVAAAAGGIVETPSPAAARYAKTLRGRAAQEEEARKLQAPPEEKLRVAVAGSRSPEGDPGPGAGVWSVDATRKGEEQLLANPFPMGHDGRDERRRDLVLGLHKRWLRAWHTPAGDMRMEDGGTLPLDVRPPTEFAALTGDRAVKRLGTMAKLAVAAGYGAIRLECSTACRAGHPCHCENHAETMRAQLRMRGNEFEGPYTLSGDQGKPPAAEPEGAGAKMARRLEGFATHVWALVGARQRLRHRAEEQTAAEAGLSAAEARQERRAERKARGVAARRSETATAYEEIRRAGKRQRGSPRAAAIRAARAFSSAQEAVEQAEKGYASALLEGWTATLPIALLSNTWYSHVARVAARLEDLESKGRGVWAQPDSVRTGDGARWPQGRVLLLWADLKGQRAHGARRQTCELVEAAEEEGGDDDADEESEERRQQRRELASAVRAATAARASKRARDQRQLHAASKVPRRLAFGEAEMSERETSDEEAEAGAEPPGAGEGGETTGDDDEVGGRGGQGAKAEAAHQAAPRGLLHERGSAAEAPQGGGGRPEAGAAAAAAGGIAAAAGHVIGRQEEKAGGGGGS